MEFKWVKAHAGTPGNEGADALAKAGTDSPPIPEPDWEALTREVRAELKAASSSASVATIAAAESASQAVSRPSDDKAHNVQKQPVAPSSQSQTSSKLVGTPSRTPARAPARTPSPPSTPVTASTQLAVSQVISVSVSETNISGRKPRIPLSLNEGEVHGSANIKISQRELEVCRSGTLVCRHRH